MRQSTKSHSRWPGLWVTSLALSLSLLPPALGQEKKVNPEADLTFTVQPRVSFPAPGSARIDWRAEAGEATFYFGKEKVLEQKRKCSSQDGDYSATLDNLDPTTLYRFRISMGATDKPKLSKMFEFDTRFNLTPTPIDPPADLTPEVAAHRSAALALAKDQSGYLLVLGIKDGNLAASLAADSRFHIIVADTDAAKVTALRKSLYAAGVLGHRVSVLHLADPKRTPWTEGFADLILSETDSLLVSDEECLRLLRPDGGTLLLSAPRDTPAFKKAEGEWKASGKLFVYRRQELKGATDWTHQYGTAGNSAYTAEALGEVSATSGMKVQWIGLPGGDFGIDRQPRMSAPLAANGRLFHQGMNRLVALNAYNGAVLWSYEIPALWRINVPHDCANWCVDDDQLYLVIRDRLWILDARTGALLHALPLPTESPLAYEWGYIAHDGDLLIGSAVRANSTYKDFWGAGNWFDKAGAANIIAQVCSDRLFAYRKSDTSSTWKYGQGVIINSTLSLHEGKLYFLENRKMKLPPEVNGRVSDRKLWLDLTTVCLDAATGNILWEKPTPRPKFLTEKIGFIQAAYGIATEHGYLAFLSEGTVNPEGVYEKKGMFRCTQYGADGAEKWNTESPWIADHHGNHFTHPVVTEDRLYLAPHIHDMETGKPTGMAYGPRRGCSTIIATKNALMFRILGEGNSPLGLWNKDTGSVSRFMRLRPSCWLNTIPTQGMLLIPEGGAGCSCGGWMETSIGFLPQRQPKAVTPDSQ